MDSKTMAKEIERRLAQYDWAFHFDRKKDTLRIEDKKTKKGVTISLPNIIAKWEEAKEQAVEEIVYYVEQTLCTMHKTYTLSGKEKDIYPVIRSTSFPTETSDGIPLVYDEHTAETRIYYALDLGNTYRLIDKKLIEQENWDVRHMKEMARFNVRSLAVPVKEDTVAGNTFYFVNTNDGYDASRILNEPFLANLSAKINGTMFVAVPHQDVLIIADIQNDTGYDVLAQLTMSFFASGRVPITALSFLYENGNLEPIFILGKNRRKQ
ncbi:uncharacterized protein YtpQ (UPF0354 family) [Anoxybacillus voinovskiensis]|uniref:UPF0354 protein GGR02_001772 n=1 Tax=Anoxybacteroides voinovskiense TaxID=230470 RepID=A0A840DUK3_9BACL|nr:DUF1444 domain-containing protein [Anoxybacillus voinovskiensis]MBB4074007.1 uncharacterized protein YtpQ (UPF0354 family) [Anoxybacillus voinovskiensis]GGJ67966.1 UPF0354 protein YtpQ [Anoxybacillus voinovskiensis]